MMHQPIYRSLHQTAGPLQATARLLSAVAMSVMMLMFVPDARGDQQLPVTRLVPFQAPGGAARFADDREASGLAVAEDDGSWDDRFGGVGVPEGAIYAMVVDGDEIFIGGDFHRVGNLAASNVARWDGAAWRALATPGGNGVDGTVYALALAGGKLYVGGHFAEAGTASAANLAVWDRATGSWSPVGEGVSGEDGAAVTALAIHGDELYVGGRFSSASTLLVNNLVKYADGRFQRVGAGIDGSVAALAFNGDYLYAGGFFTSAGGAAARNIARFSLSTSSWEAIGSGVDSAVFAITPDGNDIYIGGRFDDAGGTAARNIVRWNEVDRGWHPVGTGLTQGNPVSAVNAIVVDGDDLYMGGCFRLHAAIGKYSILDTVSGVVKYDTRTDSFKRVGWGLTGPDHAWTRTMVRSGRKLYIGGDFIIAGGAFSNSGTFFPDAGGNVVNGLVELDIDRTTWRALGPGVGGRVYTIARHDGDLYAGGCFASAGGVSASNIARWKDGRWYPLGDGLDGPKGYYVEPPSVKAILPANGMIYAAGNFVKAGGRAAEGIAAWDGTQWHPLGNGTGTGVGIESLAWSNGSLYAGGVLAMPGDTHAFALARWDGSRWNPIEPGPRLVTDTTDVVGMVSCMLADGDLLYIGGEFNLIGTRAVTNFAIYNTKTGEWSVPTDRLNGYVRSIVRHRDRIVISGGFSVVGSRFARVAAYDPSADSFSILAGISDFENGRFNALASDGRSLYLGGNFTFLDDFQAVNIARWDGQAWHTLADGTDRMVTALVVDSAGLFAGGEFTSAGEVSSHNVAWWRPAGVAAAPTPDREVVAGSLLGTVTPNPAMSEATIPFTLPGSSHVSIEIFSPRGERAAVLVDGRLDAGAHSAVWHAEGLSSGVYRCRIVAGGRVETRPIVLAR